MIYAAISKQLDVKGNQEESSDPGDVNMWGYITSGIKPLYAEGISSSSMTASTSSTTARKATIINLNLILRRNKTP